MKKKVTGIILSVIPGIVIIVLAVVLIFGIGSSKKAKLSTEKMKETVSAKAAIQDDGMQDSWDEDDEDSDGSSNAFTKTFDGYVLTGGAVSENTTTDTANAQTDPQGYLCSYSSSRLITEDDLDALQQEIDPDTLPTDKSVIQMVINEMYAKYGYQFKNEEIQAYFDAKEWYQDIDDKTSDMDGIFDDMTEIEQQNVEFLTAHNE
mgnify:CR=1 FL=1